MLRDWVVSNGPDDVANELFYAEPIYGALAVGPPGPLQVFLSLGAGRISARASPRLAHPNVDDASLVAVNRPSFSFLVMWQVRRTGHATTAQGHFHLLPEQQPRSIHHQLRLSGTASCAALAAALTPTSADHLLRPCQGAEVVDAW